MSEEKFKELDVFSYTILGPKICGIFTLLGILFTNNCESLQQPRNNYLHFIY